MFTAGLLTFLGFAILFSKLGTKILRRVLSFDLQIDIFVTASMVILLSGTYSGMMAAICGGLIFSLALSFTKHYIIGYEKLMRKTCDSCAHSHWSWVSVPRSKVPLIENTYTRFLLFRSKSHA